MALIVLLPDMPDWVRIGLVGLVAVLMLFSFVKYMIIFLHLRREFPNGKNRPDPKADSCGRLIRPRILRRIRTGRIPRRRGSKREFGFPGSCERMEIGMLCSRCKKTPRRGVHHPDGGG